MTINNILTIKDTYWNRALQVMVAATVAICVGYAFNLDYSYWVTLSAIITIRATTGASIKRAKERIFGTIMGILTGAMLLYLIPNTNYFIITVPLFTFLAVYLFNNYYYYSIFFTSILLILLLSHGAPSIWHFAFARILDTFIGVTIGLIASYLLWPNASRIELKKNLQKTLSCSQNYFALLSKNILEKNTTTTSDEKYEIENSLIESMRSFKEFSYEPGVMPIKTEAVYSLIVSLNIVHNLLLAIALVANKLADLSISNNQRITYFVQQITSGFNENIMHLDQMNPPLKDSVFNIDHWKTDIMLIEEQELKQMMSNQTPKNMALIFYVYQLKKLAIELKHINQAILEL